MFFLRLLRSLQTQGQKAQVQALHTILQSPQESPHSTHNRFFEAIGRSLEQSRYSSTSLEGRSSDRCVVPIICGDYVRGLQWMTNDQHSLQSQ